MENQKMEVEITQSLKIIINAQEFEKITEQGTAFYDCCVMSIAYSDRLGIYADGLTNLRKFFEDKNYDINSIRSIMNSLKDECDFNVKQIEKLTNNFESIKVEITSVRNKLNKHRYSNNNSIKIKEEKILNYRFWIKVVKGLLISLFIALLLAIFHARDVIVSLSILILILVAFIISKIYSCYMKNINIELESATMLSTDDMENIEEVEKELKFIIGQLMKFRTYWDDRNVRLETLIQKLSTEKSDVLLFIENSIREGWKDVKSECDEYNKAISGMIYRVDNRFMDERQSTPLERRQQQYALIPYSCEDAPCGNRPGGGTYCCTLIVAPAKPVAASQMVPFVQPVDY
ncbi:8899_t:CDS:2 [Dentiscutata erythropus]|uniref:8899_t:CDS:1 n=1 Tax=Dentiscutata erythropus TaxID=1348616 RepID=A0A9N9F9W0_9GLOM|nr:8899_t:CDS:2 [Dentiscutata erythropus]